MSNENIENNSEQNEQDNSQEIRVEMPSGFTPEFSNSIRMNVSNDMVSFQFVYVRPDTNRGVIVSEVVLTPQHAIQFQKRLRDTLNKHFTEQIE